MKRVSRDDPMTIYPKYVTKAKRAKIAGLKLYQAEIPADGIERRILSDGHKRERCLTPEARQERREELYAWSGSKCEGCGVVIYLDTFHLHHFKGRGRGRCDCMECIQALCPDVLLADSKTRFGCHTLQHQCVNESGSFDPHKSTRLGERFVRT